MPGRKRLADPASPRAGATVAESRYLGIIPARGGSKRIPGKNLRQLAGKPLLAWTLEAASRSRRLVAVVVSTDSRDIARYARRHGVDTQGLRPARLARDSSPTILALQDALRKYESAHGRVDAVVVLQPTSPFRTAGHIDSAIARFEASGADTVTSVRLVQDHPYWAWKPSGREIRPYHSKRKTSMSATQLPRVYMENGAVYVVARALIARGVLYGRRVVPFVMDASSSLDIDVPEDLHWAEFALQRDRRGRRTGRRPRQ